jgi:hypothetical protein
LDDAAPADSPSAGGQPWREGGALSGIVPSPCDSGRRVSLIPRCQGRNQIRKIYVSAPSGDCVAYQPFPIGSENLIAAQMVIVDDAAEAVDVKHLPSQVRGDFGDLAMAMTVNQPAESRLPVHPLVQQATEIPHPVYLGLEAQFVFAPLHNHALDRVTSPPLPANPCS